MRLTERHLREIELIVAAAVGGGQPQTVDSLRAKLKVSTATIYSDLNLLGRMRISRTRGLVEARTQDDERRLPERFAVQPGLKRSMAESIVTSALAPGAIVFIDTGSTCYYVAKEIAEQQRADLRVITANPYAVQALAENDFDGDVLVLGGLMRRRAASLYGSLTVDALASLNFDTAVISVDFIHDDPEGTIAIFSDAEVEQKRRAIAQASRSVIVVADDTKLARNHGNPVGTLRAIAGEKRVMLTVGVDNAAERRVDAHVQALRAIVGADAVTVVATD